MKAIILLTTLAWVHIYSFTVKPPFELKIGEDVINVHMKDYDVFYTYTPIYELLEGYCESVEEYIQSECDIGSPASSYFKFSDFNVDFEEDIVGLQFKVDVNFFEYHNYSPLKNFKIEFDESFTKTEFLTLISSANNFLKMIINRFEPFFDDVINAYNNYSSGTYEFEYEGFRVVFSYDVSEMENYAQDVLTVILEPFRQIKFYDFRQPFLGYTNNSNTTNSNMEIGTLPCYYGGVEADHFNFNIEKDVLKLTYAPLIYCSPTEFSFYRESIEQSLYDWGRFYVISNSPFKVGRVRFFDLNDALKHTYDENDLHQTSYNISSASDEIATFKTRFYFKSHINAVPAGYWRIEVELKSGHRVYHLTAPYSPGNYSYTLLNSESE